MLVRVRFVFLFLFLVLSFIVFGKNLDLTLLKVINYTPEPLFDLTRPVISSDYFAGFLGISSLFLNPTQTVITFGVTLGEIEFLKNIFKRARPFETYDWVIKRANASGYSFPSGHAAMAFESAYIWSEYFPQLSPVFYLMAICVAISRVYYGVHYPSDVIFGSFMGYLTAFVISKNLKKTSFQISYDF